MARLISVSKTPVRVKYDGQMIVVSPGEKINIKNPELLPGNLPKGLVLQENKGV